MYNQFLLAPTQLGIIVGGYSLAMLVGQAGLGSLSDDYLPGNQFCGINSLNRYTSGC
jgi:hypothetical protein